jgi:hypothetical protein
MKCPNEPPCKSRMRSNEHHNLNFHRFAHPPQFRLRHERRADTAYSHMVHNPKKSHSTATCPCLMTNAMQNEMISKHSGGLGVLNTYPNIPVAGCRHPLSCSDKHQGNRRAEFLIRIAKHNDNFDFLSPSPSLIERRDEVLVVNRRSLIASPANPHALHGICIEVHESFLVVRLWKMGNCY